MILHIRLLLDQAIDGNDKILYFIPNGDVMSERVKDKVAIVMGAGSARAERRPPYPGCAHRAPDPLHLPLHELDARELVRPPPVIGHAWSRQAPRVLNIGIEVGQIAFVLLAIVSWWLFKRTLISKQVTINQDRLLPIPVYVLGGLSAMWCIERGLDILG